MFVCLLIVVLVLPVISLAIGLLWRSHPPQKINALYGYRTRMSMKNEDTWSFAHAYCRKFCLYFGLIALILSLTFMFVCKSYFETAAIYIVCIQAITFCFVFIFTEQRLRKAFDKNGKRR